MTAAELAARLTVARSAVTEFDTGAEKYLDGGEALDWLSWAFRIKVALAGVLLALELTVPPLGDTQRDVFTLLLADALAHREPSGEDFHCNDCDATGPCPDHAADLDRTDDYLSLARDLGIEVDR